MRRTIIALFQLLLCASAVVAVGPDGIRDTFQESIDSWMNGELDSDGLVMRMDTLDGVLGRESESWETLYWRARTAYARGHAYFEEEEKDLSLDQLERSRDLARDSIRLQEHSDSWRVLAEASSLIMLQRGFAYIILHFSEGQNQAKRALELDPRNARASHIVAQFLCNAPRIAGGNLREGIDLLRDLTGRPDLIDEDRFIFLLTLGEVLRREDRIDESVEVCEEALRVYPGNRRAGNLLSDLRSRGGP